MSTIVRRGCITVLCAFSLGGIQASNAYSSVIVVDAANGPGSNATSIASAVASAADGDVLLIRSGSYGEFSVSNKSLVIAADSGASVKVDGRIHLRELALGKTISLRGLKTGLPATSAEGLLIENCVGNVLIEACQVEAGSGSGVTRAGTRIVNSFAVTLVRLDSTGAVPGTFSGGGAGLEVVTSTVVAYDCKWTGRDGQWGDDIGGNGGPGARLTFATLFASGSEFHGGRGGGADDDYDFLTGTVICGFCGIGGASIQGIGLSSVSLLDCIMDPGQGGISTSAKGCPNGSDGLPFDGPSATLHIIEGQARSLRVTSPVRDAGIGHLHMDGQAGDDVLVIVGLSPHVLPAPAQHGFLITLPAAVISLTKLGPTGTFDLDFYGPTMMPSVPAASVIIQGAFSRSESTHLSSGSAVLFLDDTY